MILQLVLSKLDDPGVTVGFVVRLEGGVEPPPPENERFRLTATEFRVGEESGAAAIGIARSGHASSPASVRLSTGTGTADANEDFEPIDQLVEMPAGVSAVEVEIPILDDALQEGDETVDLRLSSPSQGFSLGRSRATLVIEDDDEGSRVSFSDEVFTVTEDHGVATLLVERLGDSSGQVSVGYRTAARSATEGLDFVASEGRLEWPAGDSSSRAITVGVIDDLLGERSELFEVVLEDPTGATLGDRASAATVLLDDDRAPGCLADDDALCLLDGRFRLEVEWLDRRSGNRGTGATLPDSDQTGFYWFFDPSNIELIVKVLDARALNDSFWFFAGGLSDVAYWVIATDTETSRVRVYNNRQGSLRGIADVEAFPESGGAARTPEPESGARSDGDGRTLRRSFGFASTCTEGPGTLCLQDGRFQVEVSWSDTETAQSGTGVAVPRTDQSGLFWFFDAANIELVVKILDARAVNDRFWVFYGALSDVAYTITVTDTENGAVMEYTNEEGEINGRADTDAFP